MKSELRCPSGGAEIVVLGGFVCQLRNALIESSPPVSRVSSSSNYTSFFPFSFVWLRFSLLVLASSATDHSTHTPITTLFQ